MVGWLNEKESRGLLWLRGELKQGEIRFPLPDMTGGSVTTEINRTRTKVKPVLRNDELIIYVEIHAQTVIQEVTGTFPMDKQIKQLEDAQNQAVVNEVQSVLDKAQKQIQVDAFGFGEAVHRQYPEQWQQMKSDWDEIFLEIQVQLEVKTRIIGTNLTSRPVDTGSD